MSPFATWIDRAVSSLVARERRLSRKRRNMRGHHRHRCRGFEPLETRRLLAVDLGQISGTVFSDLSDNGQTGDDVMVSGATLHLYRDGGNATYDSGSGTAGGDDTLVGTTTTNASGDYAFIDLTAGTYYVEQIAPAGTMQKTGEDHQTITISVADAQGTAGDTVDEYSTAQTVSANSAGPISANDFLVDAIVLGGERDIFIEVTSGIGTSSLTSDYLGGGILQFSSDGTAVSTASVTWDGADADATALDPTGLGSMDITSLGGNPMVGFQLLLGADQAGATLALRAYSSAANWSQATLAIPDTGGAASTEELVEFSDFTTGGGTGVDFSNLGALVMELDSGTSAIDSQVALTEILGRTDFDADFAVYEPLSVGDLVWGDLNNDGLYDSGTETGISGVTVNLYDDTNSSDGYTDGVDQLLATDTTDGSGNYLFGNLFPGNYIIQIAESNFTGAGVLSGLSTSSGNDPAPDPDNDVNNDDNGSVLTGFGVITSAFSLSANAEPTNDGDADSDTNLSVDFGFFPEIDLQVTKSDSPDAVIAGNQLTYTVLVGNNGPSDATGVILTDTLPSEVTYVSGTLSNGGAVTHSAGTVTGVIGALADNDSVTATIIVTVAPGTTSTISNTATVTANENDVNLVNNTDVELTDVNPQIDLAITKFDNPDPIVPTNTLTYTLNVTNNGPSNATGVTITDTLPAGVTYVSASHGSASEVGGVVTVNLGNMAVGGTANVTILVTVDASTSGTINNTATVAANETDLNAANNTATVPTTVMPEIDLQITKDESADPVAPGEAFSYTLTVANNGPSDATGVTVTDTLPNQVTYTSSTSSQGTSSHVGGVVTANLGNLANGATATVTIQVTVGETAGGTLMNTAQVTANETETTPANNSDSEDTTVQVDPVSIAGFVYVDVDDDGLFDTGEIPIPGVTISLSGIDYTGLPVTPRTTTTAANGSYLFSNLLPGTYTVQETQPGLFPDGQEAVGSEGGTTTNDTFSTILLGSGDAGAGYNFGELPPTLSKRRFLASSGP